MEKDASPLGPADREKEERIFAYASTGALVLLILLAGMLYAGSGKHPVHRHPLKSEAR